MILVIEMPSQAIKCNDTVYVLDGVRWFEYNDRHRDLTLFYNDGTMETIRHRNARKIYNDLLLKYSVIDTDARDYD